MTSRARSHVLEDASRAYLRTLIPGSWVVHDYTHDYGVDVQIELFAENGERTAIRFYGQLKATDKSDDEDLLRLDRSHIEYWLAHTDPVAIFRYYDKTKALKWCWLDEIAWRINPDSQSLEVSRYLKNWTPETSQSEIEQFLHARRQALFQPLVPPFTISIEWIGDDQDRSPELVESIAKIIDSSSFKVVTKTSSTSHFLLQIAPQKIVCGYLGLPGFVFHQTEESGVDDLSSNALLALFFCACRYERVLFARALASATINELNRAATENLRPHFFDALIFAVGVKLAVEMLTPLLDDSPDGRFLFGVVGRKASVRYGETRSWIEVLREWAAVPPTQKDAGILVYNLANALMNDGCWDEANETYMRVLDADPEYSSREYFWAEWGCVQFECGDFLSATGSYQKALSIKDSAMNRWGLGDALFYTGQYKLALEQINRSIEMGLVTNVHAPLLVRLLCDELISNWGIESQELIPIETEEYEILKTPNSEMSKEDVIQVLKPIMQKNAVDALFSFNAGYYSNHSGYPAIAMYRYLTCALRQSGDTQAWANAIACAFYSKEPVVLTGILECAYFHVREQLLPKMLSLGPNNSTPKLARLWSQFFEEAIENLSHAAMAKAELSLRVHSANGTKIYQI